MTDEQILSRRHEIIRIKNLLRSRPLQKRTTFEEWRVLKEKLNVCIVQYNEALERRKLTQMKAKKKLSKGTVALNPEMEPKEKVIYRDGLKITVLATGQVIREVCGR